MTAMDANTDRAVTRERDYMLTMGRRLYYLGVLTIPALVLRVFGGQNVTWSDLFFAGSFLFCVLSVARPRYTLSRLHWAAVWLTLVGGMIACWVADDFGASFAVLGRIVFIVAIWPWVTACVLHTGAQVKRALDLFVLGSMAFGVVALLQTQNPKLLAASGAGLTIDGRATGMATHPSDAGALLCIALVAALGLVIIDRGRRRLFWIAGVAVIGVGMVLAASVSSFIAAAVGVLALAIRLRAKVRVLALTALGGYVALRVGTSNQAQELALSPLERFTATTSGPYDTADYRVQTWAWAWEAIQQNPFLGVGLDEVSGRTYMGLAVHNLPLLAWFQGGPLFLTGLVLFVVVAWRSGISRPYREDPVLAVLFAALVTAIVFTMTAPMLAQRFLWLPAILAIAASRARQTTPTQVATPAAPETVQR